MRAKRQNIQMELVLGPEVKGEARSSPLSRLLPSRRPFLPQARVRGALRAGEQRGD